MQGIVHRHEGLLHVEVRRPDLIRANQHDPDEGGYDLCFGGMFDEGPETGATMARSCLRMSKPSSFLEFS